MRTFAIAVAVALACTLPSDAHADILLTPYAGVNFAGSTIDPRPNVGAAVAWLGSSGLGVEVDLGFIPDFFAPKSAGLDVLGTNNVTTLMGNVVMARTIGGVQPYVSAGGGLVRSKVASFGGLFDEVTTDNGLGMNAGGGVRVGTGRFSLRGDLRYFRTLSGVDALLEDVLGDFSFWRAAGGVTIGF